MAFSREVRLLAQGWREQPTLWPKFLEWLEIHGLRGWTGQRIDFDFPIVAIIGENGTGKSTVLQAAASLYRPPDGSKGYFASDFFPSTAWESVTQVSISGSCREGNNSTARSVRRPTSKWLGNPQRRVRRVQFLDLRRTQPLAARVGYARIAKPMATESAAIPFDNNTLGRASTILGKDYESGRHAATTLDPNRSVPVLSSAGVQYSGFHQGAGENAIADLLALDFPDYSLVLVDELETSLHPRAQRRLIRDFATLARHKRLQIILTTHSPYVLQELPEQARIYVSNTGPGQRAVMRGISPDYAMTFMDEADHPELDVYVEDDAAEILVQEALVAKRPDLWQRIQFIRYGAANVGRSLGGMDAGGRFPRPSIVLIDGDQEPAAGVHLLPGADAPERVVFEALGQAGYPELSDRTGRLHPSLVDAIEQAQLLPDHHDWIVGAATVVRMGGNELWRAMCSTWANHCLGTEMDDLFDAMSLKIGNA